MRNKINIISWTTVSTYILLNVCIYLFSFWDTFNINILQFASINDLIPAILFSLAFPLVLLCLGAIATYWYDVINEKMIQFSLNVVRKYKFYPIVQKIHEKSWVMNYITVGIALFALLTEPKIGVIMAAMLMVPVGVGAYVTHRTALLSELKEYRTIAVLFLSIMPFLFYVVGYVKSNEIINGKNTFLVISDSPCIKNSDTQYRYISTISDKAFALSLKDNSICVFKYNYITITPENKKNYDKSTPINIT